MLITEFDMDEYLEVAREEAQIIGHAKGMAEGHAKGMAEGHAEGHAKGHAEGHAKGHAEGRSEGIRDNARRMKADGMDPALIEKYTGLSKEDIEKL